MKTHQWQLKYVKWFSTEEMYEAANNWVSELNFVRDEQVFFEHLLQQLLRSELCCKASFTCKSLRKELDMLKRDCNLLVSAAFRQKRKLYNLTDGIDQIDQEDLLRERHHEFIDVIGEFLMIHNQLKKDLFDMVKLELKTRRKDHLFLAS